MRGRKPCLRIKNFELMNGCIDNYRKRSAAEISGSTSNYMFLVA